MGILIGIVVIFILMFVLGVPKSIISFVGLSLLLIVAAACAIFFFVSLILLLTTKGEKAVFDGFGLVDLGSTSNNNPMQPHINHYEEAALKEKESKKDQNMIRFAFYRIGEEKIQNLFPTDSFMFKFYNIEETVKIRVCKIGKKRYAIDTITILIIVIGFPVFSILTVFILSMLSQFSYIFTSL